MSTQHSLLSDLRATGINLITATFSGADGKTNLDRLDVIGSGVPKKLRKPLRNLLTKFLKQTGFHNFDAGCQTLLELDFSINEVRWQTIERRYADNLIEQEFFIPELIDFQGTIESPIALGEQLMRLVPAHCKKKHPDFIFNIQDFIINNQAKRVFIKDGVVRGFRHNLVLDTVPTCEGCSKFQ